MAWPGELCPPFPHRFPAFCVCDDEHIWVSFPALGLIGAGGGGLSLKVLVKKMEVLEPCEGEAELFLLTGFQQVTVLANYTVIDLAC